MNATSTAFAGPRWRRSRGLPTIERLGYSIEKTHENSYLSPLPEAQLERPGAA